MKRLLLVTSCILAISACSDPTDPPPDPELVVQEVQFDSASYVIGSRADVRWSAGLEPGASGVNVICSIESEDGDATAAPRGPYLWSASVLAVAEGQRVTITCEDDRGLSATVDTAMMVLSRFEDHDFFTRIPALELDVLDVGLFYNLTHQEAIDSIARTPGGWRLANSEEVRPIFQFIEKEEYLDSVRHMLTSHEVIDKDTIFYVTGGRVANIYESSPEYRWLWGFGDGIQLWNSQADSVEYIWSTFGIGADYADVRLPNQGAWAIRSTPRP